MRKALLIFMATVISLFFVLEAVAADRAAIKKNVDGIVAGIDGGKKPTDFKANDYKPYVFIMEPGGMLLVHPSLAGKNLGAKAAPVYKALLKATPTGTWVDYQWKGKQKHSYVRKTHNGLIVGSGYSE